MREFLRPSYSQFGEDAILLWLFAGRLRDGFYVDVGCHHPYRISNTALLHSEYGWSGINIDVDRRAIEAFASHRPEDINICAGVAGQRGELEVTIFEEGAINTFSEEAAAHPAWAKINRAKHRMPVVPLRDILDQHVMDGQRIDLLDLDAEGLDLDILRSNDWTRFTPDVVCVEIERFDVATIGANPIYCFLADLGYRLVSHAAITSFFRR